MRQSVQGWTGFQAFYGFSLYVRIQELNGANPVQPCTVSRKPHCLRENRLHDATSLDGRR
jgi:hypothetical protein